MLKQTFLEQYKILFRPVSFDPNIINEIINLKVYDRAISLLKDPKIIVDLGAHIGIFSIYILTKFPEARVYAYEPEEENFNLLTLNVNLNNLQSKILTRQLAVSDYSGIQYLKLNLDHCGNHVLIDSLPISQTPGAYRPVAVLTLEDILILSGSEIDLLKMDIEGTEAKIITQETSCLNKVKTFVSELHGNLESLSKICSKYFKNVETKGDILTAWKENTFQNIEIKEQENISGEISEKEHPRTPKKTK